MNVHELKHNMYDVWISSLASVLVVSSLSLIGVLMLVFRRELSKRPVLYLVSFSVGGLLGGAFLHLIPEAAEINGSVAAASNYILIGIFASYLIEMVLK